MRTKTFVLATCILLGLGFWSSGATEVEAGSCTYTGPGGGSWSDASNWTGTCVGASGIPGDMDDVTIPNNTSTNNDIVDLVLNTLTFPGSPGGTLSGNTLIMFGAVNTPMAPHSISVALDIVGDPVTLSTGGYTGGLIFNPGTRVVANPSVLPWGISGPITGSAATFDLNNIGDAYLNQASSFSGTINVTGNSVLHLGTGFEDTDVVLAAGGTVTGGGVFDSITTDGTGNLRPNDGADTPGILELDDEINLQAGDDVQMLIVSTAPNGSDIITVPDIDIDGANLELEVDPSYTPSSLNSFLIIDANNLTGTFAGLPDGSVVHAGITDFIIEYTSTGVTLNDVGGVIDLYVSTFTANPAAPYAGQATTISLTWGTNFQTPTGTAELFDGATSLGTVALVGGVSTFVLPEGFTAGTHNLTVEYSGDIYHEGAVSTVLALNVSAALAETGVQVPVAPLLAILAISIAFVLQPKRIVLNN
jgi:hypothetical protein